jgi:hypothetical protein
MVSPPKLPILTPVSKELAKSTEEPSKLPPTLIFLLITALLF